MLIEYGLNSTHQPTVRQFVIAPQAGTPAGARRATHTTSPLPRALAANSSPLSAQSLAATPAAPSPIVSHAPTPMSAPSSLKRPADRHISPIPVAKRTPVGAAAPAVAVASASSSSSSSFFPPRVERPAAGSPAPADAAGETSLKPQRIKLTHYGPGTRAINAMDVALTSVLASALDFKGMLEVRLPELDHFIREAEIELTTQVRPFFIFIFDYVLVLTRQNRANCLTSTG